MELNMLRRGAYHYFVVFCQPLPVLVLSSVKLDRYSFAIGADVDLAIHYVDTL